MESFPKLWQDGKYTAVFDYCLDDVKLLVELYNRRHWIKDPTRDKIYRLRGGSRILNWANKLREYIKQLPQKLYFNDWKVFFWAILQTDITQVRMVFTSPVQIVFEGDSKGYFVGFRFRMPSIRPSMPFFIYQMYNDAHPQDILCGEVDGIPF